MYKILLLLLFITAISTSQAQNRASVKGKIIDSLNKEPVEMATVAIVNVKDTTSSLVSYTLSDKTGAFALHNLPSGISLKILITFVSYKPFRKIMNLAKGENIDLGTILLNPKQLKEVSIVGERVPIVIKKDTIEFNAEAFKTRPNAIVEELLKKLPGIEVDNEGNITFNGKPITKIMIDGKEFFLNDPKIASKNLDAALIDKIQVYDDRENDPDHLIEDSKVNKIINLKFKKALKQSVFGKVYAGAGTRGRFESGGLLNMFRDTLQVSLIGVGNNLSRTGFSREELNTSGGFNRGGQESLNTGGTTFGGEGYGGIQKVATGGVNINTDYGKKLKVNLLYFFSHTRTDNSDQSSNQQFIKDTTVFGNSSTIHFNTDNKHNIGGLVKWEPDTLTQIRYNPTLIITGNQSAYNSGGNSYSNFTPQISNNSYTNSTVGSNTQFKQSFSYYRRLKKKGESFTLSHNLNINPGSSYNYSDNNLISYLAILPSSDLNRYTANSNKSFDLSFTGSFRYPFTKKIIGDISMTADYNENLDKSQVYNFDPGNNAYNIFIDNLSNDLNRRVWEQNVKTGITYNFTKKTTLVMGVKTQFLQINNQFNRTIPDLNQNFINFLPNVKLTVGNFTINYDANLSQPRISDMQPIKLNYSTLYSFTGNIDLKPARQNNFNISYYNYKPASQVNLNIYGGATIEENTVFRLRTINSLGYQNATTINKTGQYNFHIGGNLGKSFKKINKWKLHTSTSTYIYDYHQFFSVNTDQGYQDMYYIGFNEGLNINWNDVVELDPSYGISTSITKYTGVAYNNAAYTTHRLDTRYSFHLPKKIDIEGNYTYTYNPRLSAGYQKSINLLNVSIAHQLLKKDHGEIKLSCYDILNQNISSYKYATQNYVVDSQSEILKRYFMLTLLYKFNKAKTK